jgi:hypothetical protein
MPFLNLASRPGVLPTRPHLYDLPKETPGTGDASIRLYAGIGVYGLYSGHDLQRDVSIPDGLTLYAPTMVPPEPSVSGRIGCLESVTVHRFDGSAMEHAFGVWRHCGGSQGWVMYRTVGSVFLLNYVRIFDGEERFFTEVYKSSGTWYAYLYNFQSSTWELQAAATGDGLADFGGEGWSMFETYFNGQCPYLPPIRSAPLQYFNGSSWSNVTPSISYVGYGFGNCFTNGNYSMHVNLANYDWTVSGP